MLISEEKNQEYCHRLIHTPKQTVYAKRAHKYQQGWKVFISLTDKYGSFIDDCGMTQSIAFIRCKTKAEAKRIQQELQQPIYRFINHITRYGNFNNVRVLQKFPKWGVPDLNQEEEDFIHQFLKQTNK